MNVYFREIGSGNFLGEIQDESLSKGDIFEIRDVEYIVLSKDGLKDIQYSIYLNVDYSPSQYIKNEIEQLKLDIKAKKERLQDDNYKVVHEEVKKFLLKDQERLKDLVSRKYLKTRKEALKLLLDDKSIHYKDDVSFIWLNDEVQTMQVVSKSYYTPISFDSVEPFELYVKEEMPFHLVEEALIKEVKDSLMHSIENVNVLKENIHYVAPRLFDFRDNEVVSFVIDFSYKDEVIENIFDNIFIDFYVDEVGFINHDGNKFYTSYMKG